jgi:hypothetical protein
MIWASGLVPNTVRTEAPSFVSAAMYASARTGLVAITATGILVSGIVAVTVTFDGLAVFVTDTAVSITVTVPSRELPTMASGPAWATTGASIRSSAQVIRRVLVWRTATREGPTRRIRMCCPPPFGPFAAPGRTQ